jgi:hypothetical protein
MAAASESAQPASQVQALTDRVRQLEQKLAEAVGFQCSVSGPNPSTAAENNASINGSFRKMRFFGNTHPSGSAYKARHPLCPLHI